MRAIAELGNRIEGRAVKAVQLDANFNAEIVERLQGARNAIFSLALAPKFEIADSMVRFFIIRVPAGQQRKSLPKCYLAPFQRWAARQI